MPKSLTGSHCIQDGTYGIFPLLSELMSLSSFAPLQTDLPRKMTRTMLRSIPDWLGKYICRLHCMLHIIFLRKYTSTCNDNVYYTMRYMHWYISLEICYLVNVIDIIKKVKIIYIYIWIKIIIWCDGTLTLQSFIVWFQSPHWGTLLFLNLGFLIC